MSVVQEFPSRGMDVGKTRLSNQRSSCRLPKIKPPPKLRLKHPKWTRKTGCRASAALLRQMHRESFRGTHTFASNVPRNVSSPEDMPRCIARCIGH
eukprot:5922654-Pyramimonas_sp.AAC.2